MGDSRSDVYKINYVRVDIFESHCRTNRLPLTMVYDLLTFGKYILNISIILKVSTFQRLWLVAEICLQLNKYNIIIICYWLFVS